MAETYSISAEKSIIWPQTCLQRSSGYQPPATTKVPVSVFPLLKIPMPR
jgi:hypothetical protein